MTIHEEVDSESVALYYLSWVATLAQMQLTAYCKTSASSTDCHAGFLLYIATGLPYFILYLVCHRKLLNETFFWRNKNSQPIRLSLLGDTVPMSRTIGYDQSKFQYTHCPKMA
jgi:hypothetical protein